MRYIGRVRSSRVQASETKQFLLLASRTDNASGSISLGGFDVVEEEVFRHRHTRREIMIVGLQFHHRDDAASTKPSI